MKKYKNKKFIFERSNFVHLLNFRRIRIPENRDLKKGLRLNRNERVQNFPKFFLKKIFSRTKNYDLGKYPDQTVVYKKLSKFLKVDQNKLLITSGIDGAIKTVFEVLTRPGDKIGILSPTYAMYRIYSNLFKVKLTEIKYNYKTFKLNKENLFNYIKSSPNIIFLPNPNQPIEDPLSFKDLKKICLLASKHKVLVVIDEAYHMFGTVSAISLINKFHNLIVLRTFSKSFGVPSIRFGYVISNIKIIKILSSFRLSYESNFLTDKLAIYLIDNINFTKNYNKKVIHGRNFLRNELKKIKLKVIGGKSNFLLIDFGNKNLCKKIYKILYKKKIYVKGNFAYPLESCILITCGPKHLMKNFFNFIKPYIKLDFDLDQN